MEKSRVTASGLAWKRGFLALVAAVMLAACGGGGGGGKDLTDDLGGDTGADPVTVEGSALAPAGGVAHFEPKGALQFALEFIAPPAAAAITGLEPVGGATVELIRVDDAGNQVGEALATTTTSTTGDYTLTLPAGVNLAGNLVVRIQGMGGVQMRAQVVTQEVDITPVSEFVLQKFIDNGADLENLTTAAVIELSGDVEEFDLTAGSDLSQMLDILEAETGDFVDARIYTIDATPGDGASVAGDYHHTELGFSLGDAENNLVGDLDAKIYYLQGLTLADGGNGTVDINIAGEESAEARVTDFEGTYSLTYQAGIDAFTETLKAPLSDDGVLSIETPFEENLEGDYGWRQPPNVLRFQKAPNANLLVGLAEEAEVRYRTTDTDGDGTPDAVDPDQKDGDEVHRSLLLFAEKPVDATVADLAGDYGRVGLFTTLTSSGGLELTAERNKLSFDGAGSIDVSAGIEHAVDRTTYFSGPLAAESGVPFTIDSDGDLLTVGGEAADGFVAADYGFFVLNQGSATDDAVAGDDQYLDATIETTLAVKLPLSMLTLQGRTYRVFLLGMNPEGAAVELFNSRFDSLLQVTSPSTAEIDLRTSSVSKTSLTAQIVAEAGSDPAVPLEASLAADGAMTFTATDAEGTFTAEGYINHDGSLGVFHSRYADAGSDPSELGLLVLVEVL